MKQITKFGLSLQIGSVLLVLLAIFTRKAYLEIITQVAFWMWWAGVVFFCATDDRK